MALWNGLTLNTNELATVFNRIHARKSMDMVVKATPLLYALFGKKDSVNNVMFRAGKTRTISGNKVEFSLLGSLPTPTTVADGSAEIAAATVNYDADIVAAVDVALAHYTYVHAIPGSEYDRFKGSEMKTAAWVDTVYDYIQGGYDKTLATALHATDAPDRTHFGGWQVPVDSSTAYLGMTRSDSANADFRGIESSMGVVTIKKIQDLKNQARTNRGNPTVGVTGLTLFGHLQQLVQGYSVAKYNKDTSEWGADHVIISGMEIMLDQDTSSGVMGFFDPTTWELVKSDDPFVNSGLIDNFTLVDAKTIHTKLWIQNFCTRPNWNIKATDCTVA